MERERKQAGAGEADMRAQMNAWATAAIAEVDELLVLTLCFQCDRADWELCS